MDANQGLSEGSLRNSHRETHAVRRKPAPASFHDLAKKLVESCTDDLILRQRLDMDRAEVPLKRGSFYVLENEGRADPGFLVFLPGKPAIYYQQRKGKPSIACTLRMRVSSSVAEGGGTILIATLDDVLHTLRLEDVWMWRGSVLAGRAPYSRRREALKEFVERHWVPDARLLGGIFTKVAQPVSLEQFSEKGVSGACHSVEFIPEQEGRRRMILYMEAAVRAATGPAGLKQDRSQGRTLALTPAAAVTPVAATTTFAPPAVATAASAAAAAATATIAPPTSQRRARAVPVDKMPDVYDLFGEDGFPISRASVQQFAISQQIRSVVNAKKEAWVMACWRPDFGGYEIQGLAV